VTTIIGSARCRDFAVSRIARLPIYKTSSKRNSAIIRQIVLATRERLGRLFHARKPFVRREFFCERNVFLLGRARARDLSHFHSTEHNSPFRVETVAIKLSVVNVAFECRDSFFANTAMSPGDSPCGLTYLRESRSICDRHGRNSGRGCMLDRGRESLYLQCESARQFGRFLALGTRLKNHALR